MWYYVVLCCIRLYYVRFVLLRDIRSHYVVYVVLCGTMYYYVVLGGTISYCVVVFAINILGPIRLYSVVLCRTIM
jgi:hypothetical protein